MYGLRLVATSVDEREPAAGGGNGGRALPRSDPLPLCSERDFELLTLPSTARLLDLVVGVSRGLQTRTHHRERQDEALEPTESLNEKTTPAERNKRQRERKGATREGRKRGGSRGPTEEQQKGENSEKKQKKINNNEIAESWKQRANVVAPDGVAETSARMRMLDAKRPTNKHKHN